MPPSPLDVPRASPPQSQSQLQPQMIRKRNNSGGQSSSLLRIIAVAICLVLAFHWFLILHHVSHHAPRGHLPGWEKWEAEAENSLGISDSNASASASGNRGEKRKKPFLLSPVCGGCYRTYKGIVPCYDLIEKYMKEHDGTTLSEASQYVGTTVMECEICNPLTCYQQKESSDSSNGQQKQQQQDGYQKQTKYWRFDQTAPKFTSPTSIVLPSIPKELRMPPEKFNDVENYIKTKYANPDPENTTNVFLFEYNPGLASIPDHMAPYLPWNAKYVLSLRVTPHNFCFGVWLTEALHEDIKQTMHSLNHLGLALLDEKYQMIPGYDVVIDIDRQLDAKRNGYMGEPAFVDYRLFNLNNDLYLHINADTVILTKLKLRAKDMIPSTDEENDKLLEKQMGEKQIKLTNLYGGDQLQVTLRHKFNTIWGQDKKSIFGKNYALFTLPNTTHPHAPHGIYAEMSIFPDHMVQQILPDQYDKLPRDRKIKWRQRRNFKIDYLIQRKVKNVQNATVSTSENGMPVPSFFTEDEHNFPGSKNPFKEFAHGGACCISVSAEQMSEFSIDGKFEGVDSLMVGVGHTLVKFYTKNKMPLEERMLIPDTHYVSFFYAFDPRPPFQLLARSGYFCLGFASTNPGEEGGTINPHSILTHNRPLQQNNKTFSCPQIHYIETIIEKVDDPSSVVIGYGMNDCTARLVEVTKKEIARLLFPDPLDMVMS